MYRKINLLLFSLCIFLLPVVTIKSLDNGQKGYINAKGVNFYEGPNYTGKKVLDTLDTGDQITLLDNNLIASNDTTRCSGGFYKISFYWENYNKKTYEGYVCSNYINFSIDTSKYEQEFANSNIPEMYWEKLALLKSSHPNWKFTGYDTGLKWSDATWAESRVGISYIQSNNPIYLSLDQGSYNPSTNTYNQLEAGGWYAANQDTVAYYMDPRNFLDEINIFMFENLGYNPTYQTKEVLQTIFRNTSLIDYVDYFINAANYNGNNISPVSLAARSRQEVVRSDGSLSDSANGGTGLYNFYNLGAFSSCSNPVACAIDFAGGYGGVYTSYNRPWDSAEKSILNGAKYIADGYINIGQNTLYFQRWNVTKNNTYSHQYMTNISAPISEGKSTYDAYSSIENLLDNEIEFIIPFYREMPESSSLPTKVDEDKKNDLQKDKAISKIVGDSGYVDNNEFITNIGIGTKAKDMINNIKNNGGDASITTDGNPISGDEVLGTGDIIKISTNTESKPFRIVVYGDVDGNGRISAVDYVLVKNYIMSSASLNGSYKIAADVNRDGKVSAVDYVNIKNYIMGNESTLR